jgi:uncharacterized protein (TIRG00374 family)
LVKSGRLDFKSLAQLLSPFYLSTCFVCTGLSLAVAAERWRVLLRAQNIFMSFKDIFKLSLIGNFFNFAMPGGVGGDIVRGFYIAKHNNDAKAGSVISVLMDRLTGLYSMVFTAIVAMIIFFKKYVEHNHLRIALILLIALFLAFSFFWLLIFSEKLYRKLPMREKFLKIYESFANYRTHKDVFFRSIILSWISQGFSILFFIFACYGLGFSEIPLSVYFFVVPLGFMLTALPISVAGIGIGQAAFLFLFNLALNTKTQVGPSAVTAYQVSLFVFGLMGAWFYLHRSHKNQ